MNLLPPNTQNKAFNPAPLINHLMKIRSYLLLPIILLAFACQSNTEKNNIAEETKKAVPEGVIFNKKTLKRLGASGDNWCLTWAADGSQIVSMCDGNWLDQKNYASRFTTTFIE